MLCYEEYGKLQRQSLEPTDKGCVLVHGPRGSPTANSRMAWRSKQRPLPLAAFSKQFGNKSVHLLDILSIFKDHIAWGIVQPFHLEGLPGNRGGQQNACGDASSIGRTCWGCQFSKTSNTCQWSNWYNDHVKLNTYRPYSCCPFHSCFMIRNTENPMQPWVLWLTRVWMSYDYTSDYIGHIRSYIFAKHLLVGKEINAVAVQDLWPVKTSVQISTPPRWVVFQLHANNKSHAIWTHFKMS